VTVETIACPDCDLLQRIPPLPPGGKARCARCGETLVNQRADPLGRPLALTVAAALALILANTTPLMGLSVVGRESSTTIIGGAYEMWLQGSEITAVIVAFCAVIAPAGHVLFMLVVLLAVRRPPAPRWVGEMLRSAHFMQPWSMTEVMMLGILVALVKIAQLATVVPGVGMYAAGAFVLLIAAVMVTFDPREVWKRVEWADGRPPPGSPTSLPAEE
jgi:paraquat-inducible protein A